MYGLSPSPPTCLVAVAFRFLFLSCPALSLHYVLCLQYRFPPSYFLLACTDVCTIFVYPPAPGTQLAISIHVVAHQRGDILR
ncbi:hypothetical protein K439DRAFT_1117316 [Ramaria rubella]|nr:hypothetical protein K439DRAFT_1117316 [Ramaria rubella]